MVPDRKRRHISIRLSGTKESIQQILIVKLEKQFLKIDMIDRSRFWRGEKNKKKHQILTGRKLEIFVRKYWISSSYKYLPKE